MFALNDYNYDLPEKLIAQKPAKQRDRSKLLFMNRENGELTHHAFLQLYDLLYPSDILVVNNTEVIPGRLYGQKETGGKAEILILNYAGRRREGHDDRGIVCECIIKSSKRPRPGTVIIFDQGLRAEVLGFNNNIYALKFKCQGDFETYLYQTGKIPLPPYIKRGQANDAFCDDRRSYQTVYASQRGAIAAPTAGLHFTKAFLEKIKSKGVKIVEITLHIGYATFRPVRVSDIRNHNIHIEWYYVSKAAAETINHAKAMERRIIAVGTTCVRTLEFATDNSGQIAFGSGSCDLFIYPG
ncbi:tRNA preQ1(34) S-adenosylmethionine ribosyltransferase-isomerase QueA, partial [Thermodesulfobacteriota bacterium]